MNADLTVLTAFFTLSVSFISMLKALAPITTLIITWCAFFTVSSKGKLVNVFIIAFGVLLSSLGEVTFAWTGFIFQMAGTVAESARLVLIQWLLAAPQGDTKRQPQRAPTADEETGIASSSSSDSESGAGDVGTSGRYSDGGAWSALPTHGHGDVQTSRDDNGRDRDYDGDIAIMSPLALLYYYAPVCAVLNGLTAFIFEAPEFDWNDLDRVGVGMLALNGGLAFLLNLTSVLLVRMPFPHPPATPGLPPCACRLKDTTLKIGKTSALTMNLAGILKSLLLVGASAIIWATEITLLQGFGYAISLAGMFYYSLPDDSESPHVVLMACLRGCAGRSKDGQPQTWFKRARHPLRELGRYRAIPEDQDIDPEGAFLLDKIDKEH